MESTTETSGTVIRPEIAFIDAAYTLKNWAIEENIDLPNISADESNFGRDCWYLRDAYGKLVARVGYCDGNNEVMVL